MAQSKTWKWTEWGRGRLCMAELNSQKIRSDFPILKRSINGFPLAFLDNAATTQKPSAVIEAESDFYRNHNANVHRGRYVLSDEASDIFESAHETVAEFVGAKPTETVFVRNATEAINLVAFSLSLGGFLKKGDLVVLSKMEHHANLVPWIELQKRIGIRLAFVSLTKGMELDLNSLQEQLKQKPKLVAISGCSNVLGTLPPIKEIVSASNDAGALVLVDGAQLVPHAPVDFKRIKADFLAFSAHKMCGPTGIGALVGRAEMLEKMPPFLTGGEMISEVFWDHATWNELPWKFEAGTPAIAQSAGFKAAVEYLKGLGMENVHAFEQKLGKKAFDALSSIQGVALYGPEPSKKCALFSFNITGVHPHDVATVLDSRGIAVRSGNHCAQPLLRDLGVDSTVRASFYIYNTEEELIRLVDGIKEAKKIFGV